MAGLGGGGKGGGGGRIETKTEQRPSPMETALANYLGAIAPEVGKYIQKGINQYPQITPQDTSNIREQFARQGRIDPNAYMKLYSKTMKPSSDIFEVALKLFGAGS